MSQILDRDRMVLPYDWMIHTLTPVHIASRRSMFQTYTKTLGPDAPKLVTIDNRPIVFAGQGTVHLDLHLGNGDTRRIVLENVYHHPQAIASSFSLVEMIKEVPELSPRFDESIRIYDGPGRVWARGKRVGGLFALEASTVRKEGSEEFYVVGRGNDAKIRPKAGALVLTSYPAEMMADG